MPSDELIWRVTGQRDRDLFDRSGRASREDFERALAATRRRLVDFRRILDFGCGCGRILRWMDDVAGEAEIHGVDIDADAIAWCQQHVPFARTVVGPHEPPLPYPDATFDLVLNHSVFTHLDEHYQDLWLAELERVTAPGGVLVLSVHGESVLGGVGDDPEHPWRVATGRDGILCVDEPSWRGTFPEFYNQTFHAPWYVFHHWGQRFRVLAYLPRNNLDYQDAVVLQRYAPDERRVVPLSPNAGR